MKAVATIELPDDIDLDYVRFEWNFFNKKNGYPISSSLVRLSELPAWQKVKPRTGGYTRGFTAGFNKFRYLITGETE